MPESLIIFPGTDIKNAINNTNEVKTYHHLK